MKLKELEGTLAVAEATVRSQRYTYKLAVEELEHIEEQIGKCLITSPASGSVVYANLKWDNESFPIETGAVVWEHRVVFRLPNSDQMQVKTRVPEEEGHETLFALSRHKWLNSKHLRRRRLSSRVHFWPRLPHNRGVTIDLVSDARSIRGGRRCDHDPPSCYIRVAVHTGFSSRGRTCHGGRGRRAQHLSLLP